MGYGVDTGYDLGDPRTATLQVVGGGDGTTVAMLTVTRPDGTQFMPAVLTTDGGTNWRTATFYTLTQAEDWVEDWVVAGTGYGREGRIVRVGTTAAPVSQTGVYATAAQYQGYIGAPPANFPRLARKASLDLDAYLVGQVYDITDPVIVAALAEACCEQIAWYLDNGWLTGAPLPATAVSIGSASVSGLAGGSAQGAPKAGDVARAAAAVLQRAGITGGAPYTAADWTLI